MEGEAIFQKIETIKMPARIGIFAGIIVLFLAAFIWFVYIPKSNAVETTTSSIDDLDQQLNRAKLQRAKLPEKQKERAELDLQLQEALKLLPNEKEISSLLSKVTELGNESQLDFRVFTPKSEQKKELYIEIPVAITVSGTYHNVAIFFEKVGKMERIMNIKNVSMKPVSDRSTTLTTTCDAITYTFRGN
ncbi:MAG: type 4a pilus biogenesis protein PilO [Deltaproteobacteria bacterium]|nr:type 4a pilus biogenesis protein PilO [Deltaproteobacteria bacterium]